MSAILSAITAAVAAASGAVSLLNDPSTQNYSHIAPGSTARSGVRIATDRDVDERDLNTYTAMAAWLQASGTASDYEVRCTVNSGSLDAGSAATGSYLALSSSREWYCESTGGVQSANLTIDLRKITDTDDSVSFTVTLSADGTPI